jgi:gliding motility-associated-like protein
VGIKSFLYFRIYNRWGQLIFQTNNANIGWNGLINGLTQQSGTYVYTTEGIDYTGKPIFRKGTTVLIR